MRVGLLWFIMPDQYYCSCNHLKIILAVSTEIDAHGRRIFSKTKWGGAGQALREGR